MRVDPTVATQKLQLSVYPMCSVLMLLVLPGAIEQFRVQIASRIKLLFKRCDCEVEDVEEVELGCGHLCNGSIPHETRTLDLIMQLFDLELHDAHLLDDLAEFAGVHGVDSSKTGFRLKHKSRKF